jgi:hypothetical protein
VHRVSLLDQEFRCHPFQYVVKYILRPFLKDLL